MQSQIQELDKKQEIASVLLRPATVIPVVRKDPAQSLSQKQNLLKFLIVFRD